MGATRLLTSSRRGNSLDGTLEEVAEFECFNEVTNGDRLVGVFARVDTTYEFQIMLLSLMPTWGKVL